MVIVTTWPPPWPGTESQQPLSSPNPLKPEPVKSDSSQAMKMTELPVQACEFMIALTVFITNESPAAISAGTWEKSHGSSGVEARRPVRFFPGAGADCCGRLV